MRHVHCTMHFHFPAISRGMAGGGGGTELPGQVKRGMTVL